MPLYRVRPGYRHGWNGRYGPGDTLELTEDEARGILDKLELVQAPAPVVEPKAVDEPEPAAVDLSIYPNTRAVMDAVKAGELDAATVLKAERSGQNRVTLIRQLEALLNGADSSD